MSTLRSPQEEMLWEAVTALAAGLDALEAEVAKLKRTRSSYAIDHTAIPTFAKERMAEIEDDGA